MIISITTNANIGVLIFHIYYNCNKSNYLLKIIGFITSVNSCLKHDMYLCWIVIDDDVADDNLN